MNLNGMSYNQLAANLKKGNVSLSDIRKEYQRSRAAANKAIKRIEKSEVPFSSGAAKPVFTPSSQVPDKDILKALADVNRFRESPYGTVRARKKARDSFIMQINKDAGREIVSKSNYGTYINFMEWFRDNKLNKIYGSKDDIIEDFFEENWEELESAEKNDWFELFDNFIDEYIEGL